MSDRHRKLIGESCGSSVDAGRNDSRLLWYQRLTESFRLASITARGLEKSANSQLHPRGTTSEAGVERQLRPQ